MKIQQLLEASEESSLEQPEETRAQKMYNFIKTNLEDGHKVFLQTRMRITKLSLKHLPLVRLANDGRSLEIKHGKRWIDYTWVDRVYAE